MGSALTVSTFSGTPHQLGAQHGEAYRELVRDHLARVHARLATDAGWSPGDAAARALAYRAHVVAVAPQLDDEIGGLAAGAAIGIGDAYLLQLRAELGAQAAAAECTTFALAPERTAGLGTVAGGNSDLPAGFADLMVAARLRPRGAAPMLSVAPAGQIAYVGLNAHGLAVFGNSLVAGGWRQGFPRYLLSRLVLGCASVTEAAGLVGRVRRAATRNLLLADRTGAAASIETTPTAVGRVEPEAGVLVHANHFASPDLAALERAGDAWMVDSCRRADRLRRLLDVRRPLTNDDIEAALRDRHGLPYAISREPGEDGTDFMSVVSCIARPTAGVLSIAKGPPHRHRYVAHEVEA